MYADLLCFVYRTFATVKLPFVCFLIFLGLVMVYVFILIQCI